MTLKSIFRNKQVLGDSSPRVDTGSPGCTGVYVDFCTVAITNSNLNITVTIVEGVEDLSKTELPTSIVPCCLVPVRLSPRNSRLKFFSVTHPRRTGSVAFALGPGYPKRIDRDERQREA